jgi:diguanylate cyclase (GGDEF)-like protein
MPFLYDVTTWIAVVSALGAAAGAAALSVIVFYVVLRKQMVAELARELERAREQSSRQRELAGIGSTIELDDVLSLTLDRASSLRAVDAVMIVVPQAENGPLVAARGLSREEADHRPLAAPPTETRAIGLSYRYAPEFSSNGDRIRGGLAVPLRSGEDDVIGTLAVFWREEGRRLSDADVATLEELAVHAGPAIDNARRFGEARKLAELDALTNLHNRRYFHETLAREVARAHRYDRRLALVIFDIDDFKAINERVGHLAGDAVLAQLAERVRSVVRSADIACRVGGDEFAVILPESALADAQQLYRRVQLAVANEPTGAADRLHLSAGIAELTPADDAISLFERADDALFRAKETGKGHALSS